MVKTISPGTGVQLSHDVLCCYPGLVLAALVAVVVAVPRYPGTSIRKKVNRMRADNYCLALIFPVIPKKSTSIFIKSGNASDCQHNGTLRSPRSPQKLCTPSDRGDCGMPVHSCTRYVHTPVANESNLFAGFLQSTWTRVRMSI